MSGMMSVRRPSVFWREIITEWGDVINVISTKPNRLGNTDDGLTAKSQNRWGETEDFPVDCVAVNPNQWSAWSQSGWCGNCIIADPEDMVEDPEEIGFHGDGDDEDLLLTAYYAGLNEEYEDWGHREDNLWHKPHEDDTQDPIPDFNRRSSDPGSRHLGADLGD